MRVLGVDLGAKRIGLAISDPSRTLARPMATLSIARGDALERVLREVERLSAEDDGLSAVVVGVPRRMDGSAGDASAAAIAFINALRRRTAIPIVAEDERLTSREAESRLAVNERDWRKRKHRLDAAAAAVILQDFLDRPHE
jgi:putative Holliday junction resolvase